MWRVILVDDEEYVRAELAALFPWRRFQFELIGEAESAAAAMKLIAATQPDLVIADIRMPETDGLTLISRLRQQACQPVLAVVSAYNDFQLVREALRLGTVDYLIKAEATLETAAAFLERLSAIMAQRADARQQQAELTGNLARYQLLAAEALWRDVLTQAAAAAELQARAEQLGIAWETSWFGLIWVHFVHYQAWPEVDQAAVRQTLEASIQANWDWNWAWRLLDWKRGDLIIVANRAGDPPGTEEIAQLQAIAQRLADDPMKPRITGVSTNFCVFGDLAANFRQVWEAIKSDPANLYPQGSTTIHKALVYLQANFTRDLSLETVAGHVGVSKSYLSRAFPEYIGEHFSAYLQRLRIERAQELLRRSEAHIYEIAAQVGFWNSRYFSKVFQDVVGMTPADYRRASLPTTNDGRPGGEIR